MTQKLHLLFIALIASCYSLNAQFITTWETTAANEEITIPTTTATGESYNYTVNWGDGNISNNHTGNAAHTYTTAGTYTVSITGDFPRIYFNNRTTDSKLQIQSIEQWGSQIWTSMESAFYGCANLIGNATDHPDLSNVTNMSRMFTNAPNFDQALSTWNVSNVTDMSFMFLGATSFNQALSTWNVGNVTNMEDMFENATLSTNNYDALLLAWSKLALQNGVPFHGGNSTYCTGRDARAKIIADFGWSITDGDVSATNCTLSTPDIETNNNLVVYPNPSHANLFVSSKQPINHLAVYNIQGALIVKSDKDVIDVSSLSNGVYLLKITTHTGTTTKQFIKN